MKASPALPGARHDRGAAREAWRILRKIRCCPRRATDPVEAIVVLVQTR
jgi:hypothetical protein